MKKLFFLFALALLTTLVNIHVFGGGVSATSTSNTKVTDIKDNINPDNYYRFELYHIVIGKGAKSTAVVYSEYQYQRYFYTEVEGQDGKRKSLGSYYDSKYIYYAKVTANGGDNGYAKAYITW